MKTLITIFITALTLNHALAQASPKVIASYKVSKEMLFGSDTSETALSTGMVWKFTENGGSLGLKRIRKNRGTSIFGKITDVKVLETRKDIPGSFDGLTLVFNWWPESLMENASVQVLALILLNKQEGPNLYLATYNGDEETANYETVNNFTNDTWDQWIAALQSEFLKSNE